MLQAHRASVAGSEVGEAGREQGLNTGVGLLHLARMRQQPQLHQYRQPAGIAALAARYSGVCIVYRVMCVRFHFRGALGHQDWWNLVSWAEPAWRHHLPCNYNMQVCCTASAWPADQ